MTAMTRFRDWIRSADDTDLTAARSVFVVGLGRFGAALAQRLVALDVEVMAIDTSRDRVNSWADRLTEVRVADGSNPAVLKQLGAEDFDAVVVAIGTGLESSILTTSALADAGCTNIWAKAITSEHGRILERVGAHHVVYPERQAGERVAHVVAAKVLDYFQLDDGFVLVEMSTPAVYAGSVLGETDIRQRFGVTVVCIKPAGRAFTYANVETVLGPNDLLVIAGTVDDVDRFAAVRSL